MCEAGPDADDGPRAVKSYVIECDGEARVFGRRDAASGVRAYFREFFGHSRKRSGGVATEVPSAAVRSCSDDEPCPWMRTLRGANRPGMRASAEDLGPKQTS